MNRYYFYILSNLSRTLYIGVTSDLPTRVRQHKDKHSPGFSARYNISRLVYFEETTDVHAAIAREKQVKGWTRKRKIELVSSMNPRWHDLSEQKGFYLPVDTA